MYNIRIYDVIHHSTLSYYKVILVYNRLTCNLVKTFNTNVISTICLMDPCQKSKEIFSEVLTLADILVIAKT